MSYVPPITASDEALQVCWERCNGKKCTTNLIVPIYVMANFNRPYSSGKHENLTAHLLIRIMHKIISTQRQLEKQSFRPAAPDFRETPCRPALSERAGIGSCERATCLGGRGSRLDLPWLPPPYRAATSDWRGRGGTRRLQSILSQTVDQSVRGVAGVGRGEGGTWPCSTPPRIYGPKLPF